MSKTERSGHTTTNHEFIKQWVTERGGHPACVRGTGEEEIGVLRIDFPGYSGSDSLDPISWDEWFEKFEEAELAFLHRDIKGDDGGLDRFNKLVKRTGDEDGE